MKTHLRWCLIALLLVVLGASIGGLLANLTYRPDQTWGDLRPLATLAGAVLGALAVALFVGVSFLVVCAWHTAHNAAVEYSHLPPDVARVTSREWFVLRPTLLVLSPIIVIVLFKSMNSTIWHWRMQQYSNSYSSRSRSGTARNPAFSATTPTNSQPAPLVTQTPTSIATTTNATAQPLNVSATQKAWGDFWYPNASLLPPHPTAPRRDVPFAPLMLISSDSFDNVVNHYKTRAPLTTEQENHFLFRGPRGDGRAAFVGVRRYPGESGVYICLSAS